MKNLKNILLAVLVVIVGIAITFIVLSDRKEEARINASEKTLYSLLSSPQQNECVTMKENEVTLLKRGDHLFLKDSVRHFELNVSSLKNISLTHKESQCRDSFYELQMYDPKPDKGYKTKLLIKAPYVNNLHLSLEEYATKLGYKEGQHAATDSLLPFRSSSIETKNFGANVKVLTWNDIFTDQPTYGSNTAALRHYLVEIDNQVIEFQVFALEIPVFTRATNDFNEIMNTLQRIN